MGRKAIHRESGSLLYGKWHDLRKRTYSTLDCVVWNNWLGNYLNWKKWAIEHGYTETDRFMGKRDYSKPDSPGNTIFETKQEWYRNRMPLKFKRHIGNYNNKKYSKISSETEHEIRYQYHINNISNAKLAKLYDISECTCNKIIKGIYE